MALGFDCPNCGATTVFNEDASVEDIRGSIYECEGCGENILMDNYVGDRDEAAAESPTDTDRSTGGDAR